MNKTDWRSVGVAALIVIAAEAAVIVALVLCLVFYDKVYPRPPCPTCQAPPAQVFRGPSACYYDKVPIQCESITIIPRAWVE
jgi:hypothetical protein